MALVRKSRLEKQKGGGHTVAPEPEMPADDPSKGDMGLPKFTFGR